MISYYDIIFIAFALAFDAFSVALAAGSYFKKANFRQKFRLSFHFGFFQFLMPIVGWLAGNEFVSLIADYDHWIAFTILFIIGAKMIWDSFKTEENIISKDISKGWALITLSIATSIDALAVGFSFGILKHTIFLPSIIIGIVASIMTLLGIFLGEKLSNKIGNKATIFGGLILILIGLNIVFEHLNISIF